jgi:triosephosphate isomerase
MLRSLGVEQVIVGHSEERAAGDTDAKVSRRARAAIASAMSVIVCVGEKVRDENALYLDGLKDQIKGSLADIPKRYAKDVILAYEPVWAIGAKEAMSPSDVHETTLFVKKVFADIFGPEAAMKLRILYGGAVNFRNAPDILSVGRVNGLLVGRESVNLPGFIELLKAVDSVKL